MELYFRIGAVDNNFGSDLRNLSKSFLLMLCDDYLDKFGNNLKCFILENSRTPIISEFSDALNSLKLYCLNKSVIIGIDQSSNLISHLDLLRPSDIVPVLFLSPDQKLETTVVQNNKITDIYIDMREMNANYAAEDTTRSEQFILDKMLVRIEDLKKSFPLIINQGVVLPVQNAFLLDSFFTN
jgi:hypothetical protein